MKIRCVVAGTSYPEIGKCERRGHRTRDLRLILRSYSMGSWTGKPLHLRPALHKLPKVADERLRHGPAITPGIERSNSDAPN